MKEVFSAIAVIIAIVSYFPYVRDMVAGRTKPSAMTWFVWATLTGIAFIASLSDGGGVGTAAVGLTTVVSIGIFLGALKVGTKDVKRVDWYFFIASLIAIAAWLITDGPLLSVVLITLIDAAAYAPTVRKTYRDPYSETLISHFLSGVKFVFVVFALENYSTITVLYPAFLVVANFMFTTMVILRRRTIPNSLV